jgi:hypothetical protein
MEGNILDSAERKMDSAQRKMDSAQRKMEGQADFGLDVSFPGEPPYYPSSHPTRSHASSTEERDPWLVMAPPCPVERPFD